MLVVEADADETPEDPEEFYDHQLVGLAVVTADGEPLGEISELLHLPAQDVLAVKRPDGTEVLIPFIKQFVPDVDVAGGRVVVDPPAGLLDLDSVVRADPAADYVGLEPPAADGPVPCASTSSASSPSTSRPWTSR